MSKRKVIEPEVLPKGSREGLRARKAGSKPIEDAHILFFTIEFAPPKKRRKPAKRLTSPVAKMTHSKQRRLPRK